VVVMRTTAVTAPGHCAASRSVTSLCPLGIDRIEPRYPLVQSNL
jgi:hypothetical protein